MSEGNAPTGATRLGSIDVTLFLDPSSYAHTTQTKLLFSERVAPEAALAIGALLFAQRQMRAISDPARTTATTEMADAVATSRRVESPASSTTPPGRVAATFRIDLSTTGTFRIDVDQHLEGILLDVAAGLTASGMAVELLRTLSQTYRIFYREMLEAALGYWRNRRPSAIESTWDWGVALRRLRYLVGQGGTAGAEPVACESCQALRPAGWPCLRCGAAGGTNPLPVDAPQPVEQPIYPASIPPTPPVIQTTAQPPVVPPVVAAPAASTVATPAPSRPDTEHTILPASTPPSFQPEETKKETDSWPLASFPRRLGGLVFDLVSGVVLGLVGGAGLTAVLIASGSFASGDNPGTFLAVAAVIILALYLCLGWIKGETLGMLVFRMRILNAADRSPVGLPRSVVRGLGTALLLAVGIGVFALLWTLDNQATFIQGAADMAIRVIAAVIGLYIIWMGSAQPILSKSTRQTWGDRIAGTVVAVRKSG
jgi:hypothetical protein